MRLSKNSAFLCVINCFTELHRVDTELHREKKHFFRVYRQPLAPELGESGQNATATPPAGGLNVLVYNRFKYKFF